jgi:hypothetical protein
LALTLFNIVETVFSATPQELLKGYENQPSKASPVRGEQFFNTKHGKEWSCASCHENPPNHDTKHIITGKVIKPLAPSANPSRFIVILKLKNGTNVIVMMYLDVNVLPKKRPTYSLG